MKPLVALSIRQPYAWLIINAGKDIENRTWRTRHRGRVLIHASLRYAGEYQNWPWEIEPPPYASFRRGGIVGEAEIIDVIDRRNGSPWFEGPYGFVLANVRPRRFRACRGMPGLFVPDYD